MAYTVEEKLAQLANAEIGGAMPAFIVEETEGYPFNNWGPTLSRMAAEALAEIHKLKGQRSWLARLYEKLQKSRS